MKKSMIEVAYQVLTNNNGSMPFVDLWKDVSQEMGFNQTQFEDNIAQFYTDLSLDGRFLNMSQILGICVHVTRIQKVLWIQILSQSMKMMRMKKIQN
jgi:DNA-directed RNA polymerase delta subunit